MSFRNAKRAELGTLKWSSHPSSKHIIRAITSSSSLSGTPEKREPVTEISSSQDEPLQSVEDVGSREAFLGSFTPEDDRAIMKKVDKRFLLLIDILYMTKNVSVIARCTTCKATGT
jgi:hypothetical protein